MNDGRTLWWAKDSGWWRRERIVELCQEFGTDGAAVIDWLTCEAKAQGKTGEVKAGYHAIAHGCFLSPDVPVRPIVSLAVSLGLLDDFKESDRTFTCRISGWEVEQARAMEVVKKRTQRARPSEEHADLQGDPDGDDRGPDGTRPQLSPVVPKCPPTGQDRTVKERTTSSPSVEIDRVFDAWVASAGRDPARTELTADRKRLIAKAIKTHGLDDSIAAVRNIGASDDARNGYGRGTPFNDIKHALGTAERIERWRDQPGGTLAILPRGPRGGSPRDTADADVARYLADAERLKAIEDAERRPA